MRRRRMKRIRREAGKRRWFVLQSKRNSLGFTFGWRRKGLCIITRRMGGIGILGRLRNLSALARVRVSLTWSYPMRERATTGFILSLNGLRVGSYPTGRNG